MSELKLNIGCGTRIMGGYVNVDKMKLPNVDLVWDLEKTPLPFESGSVDEVRAEHILEHLVNFVPLMEDLHRVCRPDVRILVLAPYYKYEAAYRDPTHVRFFTEHSFDYFQDGVEFSHYSPARFEVMDVEKRVRFISSVKNRGKRVMQAIPNFLRPVLDMFMWNVYSELRFDLRVVKEERCE